MNLFSERTINNKVKITESNEMYFFSERNNSKKVKDMDDLQKTPKKEEDKIKIIPGVLLNNFSSELNLLKNKGLCK